jgi:hypothetical protein
MQPEIPRHHKQWRLRCSTITLANQLAILTKDV